MGSVTAARVAAPTLLDVIPSFERHLRAENKAARTIQSYTEAVRRLHDLLGERHALQIVNITPEHRGVPGRTNSQGSGQPGASPVRLTEAVLRLALSRDERGVERRIVKADPRRGIPWNYEGGGLLEGECVCTAEYFREPITDDVVRLDPVDPATARHFGQCGVRLGDRPRDGGSS